MEDNPAIQIIVTILLIIGSAFFVATEYALVSVRRSRIEARARKGSKNAKLVLHALDNMQSNVASIQVGITIIGILVGSLSEPYVHRMLSHAIPVPETGIARAGVTVFSFVLITFFLVVLGELIPKYLSLRFADALAVFLIRPLQLFRVLLLPLAWLVDRSAAVLLRAIGIRTDDVVRDATEKEELIMMIRAGALGGTLEKAHAEMVSRTIKLDQLMARDIMIHRMDIGWLEVSLDKEELIRELSEIPHNRIPVCRGDVDEVLGVAYLHDIMKKFNDPAFDLEKILRPAVMVPENLTLDRLVQTMRESKSQIVIVLDEYGGTSGMITLEDVVEEVFGDLEDSLESDRPTIEVHASGRISARAEIRFDELVYFLGVELPEEPSTDTLANIIVTSLDRIPRPGDHVETPLGLLRVENMTRKRITRVGLHPTREVAEKVASRPR
ncbi:MAG: HlyC/CorC family transporter [Fimbriimonadaceae bacterium]|nr:HlyC/CorC family transporter [Fimbriimonadaceae bacterium]